MSLRKALLLTVMISSFLAACTGRSAIVWDATERSGLGGRIHPVGKSEKYMERFISVPFDSNSRSQGNFNLYYFSRFPPKEHLAKKKTVLYVAGGPGQITRMVTEEQTFATFLSDNEYQVVSFHLRGSGFSQIPESNEFDRFLRTSYAVDDIEAIRQDLERQKLLRPDGKWDAIIGWSYGTILAQQYANRYQNNVEKLVLIGPMSRHNFALFPQTKSTEAFNSLNQEVHNIQRHSLYQIWKSRPEFKDVEPTHVNRELDGLLDKVFGKEGILPRTERLFDNLQFLIDHYCQLETTLTNNRLKYAQRFFEALRGLRMVGWISTRDRVERDAIGTTIIDELRIDHKTGERKYVDLCVQSVETQNHHRSSYVMGSYDGISPSFLREWFADEGRGFLAALKRSTGTADANHYVEKVGITSDVSKIKPWNPADFSHNVPTLILKGRADPVSAAGAAEHFFYEGLKGPRTLVEFPGVGHKFMLPETSKPDWNGTLILDEPNIPPQEVRQVTGRVVGTRLNQKYELKPHKMSNSTDDQGSFEIVGFGLLKDELIEEDKRASVNVIALIKNTGKDVLQGYREWPFSNPALTATVRFDLPGIEEGKTKLAYGVIVGGNRRIQTEITSRLPNGNDDGLEVRCSKVGLDKVTFWYVNTGGDRTVIEDPRIWTISSNGFIKDFNIKDTPEKPLKTGQLLPSSIQFSDVLLDPDDEIQLEESDDSEERSDKSVFACVPRGQTDPVKRKIIIWNRGSKPWSTEGRIWLVDNELYTARVRITSAKEVPPDGGFSDVDSIVEGLQLKGRPELVLPKEVNHTLQWHSLSIVGEDRVAILLENKSETMLKDVPRHWRYWEPTPPLEKREGGFRYPCRDDHVGIVRDCLLYSFLSMDTEDFRARGVSNAVLDILRDNFPDEKLVEHCAGGYCQSQKSNFIVDENLRN